ncbi:keratin-associated protein 21-1-like [Pecten maximus]|uniref:keratin-associated protein 21-1-like n=1 Tax=Pecten maximus TaxID=6579 RepID=UPI001458CBE9|nr:keratin-associated protein 21-1-like [Pecten maximus]
MKFASIALPILTLLVSLSCCLCDGYGVGHNGYMVGGYGGGYNMYGGGMGMYGYDSYGKGYGGGYGYGGYGKGYGGGYSHGYGKGYGGGYGHGYGKGYGGKGYGMQQTALYVPYPYYARPPPGAVAGAYNAGNDDYLYLLLGALVLLPLLFNTSG